MSLKDDRLEQQLHSILRDLERVNDRVGPTNLRHYISEQIVETRKALMKYDQELSETDIDHFHPERDVARKYIRLLKQDGVTPVQDLNGTTEPSHLMWMLYQIATNDSMSVTKRYRWLGFVQGCLVKENYITIYEERNDTRERFNGR